jgi:hypothetical protein
MPRRSAYSGAPILGMNLISAISPERAGEVYLRGPDAFLERIEGPAAFNLKLCALTIYINAF